jgi:hypothetical protein
MALTPPGTRCLDRGLGSHFESNTLALLACYLFLDLCAATEGRGWRRALLGALMGFSIWFGYQCLVWVVAIRALELPARSTGFFRPALGLQAAGLAAGLLPWLAYNLRYDFAGLSIYGSSLLATSRRRRRAMARSIASRPSSSRGFRPPSISSRASALSPTAWGADRGRACSAAGEPRRRRHGPSAPTGCRERRTEPVTRASLRRTRRTSTS